VNEEDDIRRITPGGRGQVDLEHYDTLALEYLNNGHDEFDFADDVRDFLRENAGAAPTSVSTYKAAVISWLAENHIYLPAEMTRRIKVGGRPLTHDRAPTQEELRHILNHSDLQMRAYILALSSSGMRPGEGLGIEWSDIDLERGKVHIRKEVSKTGEPRDTFISSEAREILLQWKRYHPAYAEKIDGYTVPEEFVRDTKRVFPLTYNGLRDKYVRILEKTGLDEKDASTGWYVLRLHVMRKYFRTRLPQGGASVDVVEALLGHEGYLGGAYVRLVDEEIEGGYRAAESALWVFKTRPINEEQLKHLERENLALRGEISDIRRQMAVRAPVESYLDVLLRDPEGNAAKLRRLKEVLSEL
jgi:integrase